MMKERRGKKKGRKDRHVRCTENRRSQHGGFCAKRRLWLVFALNAPFATFWRITSAIILDPKKVDMREFCIGKNVSQPERVLGFFRSRAVFVV